MLPVVACFLKNLSIIRSTGVAAMKKEDGKEEELEEDINTVKLQSHL